MSIRRAIAAVLALHCLGPQDAAAQVVTDGSLGPGVALNGPDFVIGEALGTRAGSNLFHSFSDFNVLQGQSATFTSNFAGATSNVISRVTGANASIIDGLLRSEIAGADFWLINPNGLVFGANAQLDVPAGFYASTADVLELAGGGEFRATNPGASSLTIAPPSAFGFLDATVGGITVTGSNLSVANGAALSLVGGAIQLHGASLEALSGRVDLVAVASAGEVSVDAAAGTAPDITGVSAFGAVLLDSLASIDAGASGAQAGGTVSIIGSYVTVYEGSRISASTAGAADAGDILVDASSRLMLADNGSLVAESTSAAATAGDAGRLTLTAPEISMSMGGRMSVDTTGGAGGRILMNTNSLGLHDTSSTQISADTHGNGRGGDIIVRGLDSTEDNVTAAGSVTVALGSSIHSDSTASGAQAGQAGTITIHSDVVRLAMGGFMTVSTVDGAGSDGQGNALGGAIEIRTNLLVTEESGFLLARSTGAGQGGDISVQAFNLNSPFRIIAKEDGAISTSTSGTGDAGSIALGSAAAPIDFLQIGTPNLPFEDARGLFSESTATGPDAGGAGSIAVFANRVDIQGAQLSVATVDGVGGNINLNVGTLQLGTFGIVSAATTGTGAGGSITILANDPDLTDNRPAIEFSDGLITTNTSGSGDAGRITLGSLDAPIDFLWMHDFEYDAPFHQPNNIPHGLSSDSTGTGSAAGAGGEITVYANSVEVRDGVGMSASTVDGDGGAIQLHVEDLRLLEFGRIAASTTGTGDAGDIRISGLEGGTDLLVVGPTQVEWPLEAGLFTTSTAMGADAGAAGSMTIEALDIDVSGGFIGATTEDGAGGSVDIRVDHLQVSEGGIFAGTSGEGDGGQVLVRGMSATATALVEITTGGRISSSSAFVQDLGPTRTAGNAGNISITATELRLSSNDIVTRVPAIDGATGDGTGGLITLFVDTLTMDGGVIQAYTGGTGHAGTISITGIDGAAANLIELRSPTSFITTNTNTLTNRIGGDAGSIDIASRNINILAGGILSNTPGSGAGGSIHIEVDNLNLQGEESQINVGSSGPGNAGNIVIEGIGGAPATSITLSDGSAIRSEAAIDPNFLWGFLGAAGSISIDALSMTLDGLAELSVDTASEDGGGVIDIGVDTLAISSGAAINARTSGFGLAGDINIHGVDGGRATSVELAGQGSRISSASVGAGENAGAAGNISISAGSVTVADSAAVTAATVDGQGGAIAMDVGQLSVSNGGLVSTNAQGDGAGGSIVVTANEVLIDGGQVVAQSTDTGSTAGSAGDISIAAGQLSVTDSGPSTGAIDASTVDGAGGSIALEVGSMSVAEGGSIQASTSGAGAGGSITIDASGTVLVEGGELVAQSTATGPTAGSAGDISVAAGELHVMGSESSAGTIDASTVDGAGGSIALEVGSMSVAEGGSIQASTSGAGAGGSITIDASGTVLVEGGELVAQSTATGPTAGSAGDISVAAGELHVMGSESSAGTIDASTVDGAGGSIAVEVGSMSVAEGGSIQASTSGAGAGGDITIDATGTVLLDAGGLLAESRGSGDSGSVSVAADELRMQNGASISVRATDTGRAGSVFADLGSLFMSGNSRIDATATSSLAGNVELNVSKVAFLQDSVISGLSADPENDGGSFVIQHPQALVLQRSSILANSASGTGGNISISADAIVLDTESTVEATGQVLTSGEVLAFVQQVEPPVVVDAAAALDTRCTAQQVEARSSLVVRTIPPGAVREPYLPGDAAVAPASCRP